MARQPPLPIQDLTDLTPIEQHYRRREWNRGPLQDLFPRIPGPALERVLDLCIAKAVTYNLSTSGAWNARRYTCMVVAHVRHAYTEYDALLRGGQGGKEGDGGGGGDEAPLERFAARNRTAPAVWKKLREWCPWEDSNPLLEPCFRATLLRPEERGPGWDPMDIDFDEDEGDGFVGGRGTGAAEEGSDDPMDLD